jgi:hypothetical protein
MVAVSSTVDLWWVPLPGFGLSAVMLALAVVPRSFDRGAKLSVFYAERGGGTRVEASRQMLAQMLAAIRENDLLYGTKNESMKSGMYAFFGSLVAAVIVGIESFNCH